MQKQKNPPARLISNARRLHRTRCLRQQYTTSIARTRRHQHPTLPAPQISVLHEPKSKNSRIERNRLVIVPHHHRHMRKLPIHAAIMSLGIASFLRAPQLSLWVKRRFDPRPTHLTGSPQGITLPWKICAVQEATWFRSPLSGSRSCSRQSSSSSPASSCTCCSPITAATTTNCPTKIKSPPPFAPPTCSAARMSSPSARPKK